MAITITRRIEFDAGHRIPDHKSKCRNFHGHRYVLEATLAGTLSDEEGASDRGMVKDFGDLKLVMQIAVGDRWDHAFLVYKDDSAARTALGNLGPEHRTVVLDVIPTVENLVCVAAEALEKGLIDFRGVWLQHVRLYETPNCWADWAPKSEE